MTSRFEPLFRLLGGLGDGGGGSGLTTFFLAVRVIGLQGPVVPLANPIELFRHGSFHGGIWRQAYKIGSIGEMAAVLFYLRQALPYAAMGLSGGVAAAVYFAQQA